MTASAPSWTPSAWPIGCGSCRAGWIPCSDPGGVGLSAGQAQVLACARVFLRDPDVVILDEASSRLDPATERLVHTALGRLLDGRTGIIVAHRLATVAYADDILVLEDGQVREHGPRLALAADPDLALCAIAAVSLLKRCLDDAIPTWRYLAKMIRFAPGICLLHGVLWGIMNLSALLPGLIARAFFDSLYRKCRNSHWRQRPGRLAGVTRPRPAQSSGSLRVSSKSPCGSP